METHPIELVVLEEGNNATVGPMAACCVSTFGFMF